MRAIYLTGNSTQLKTKWWLALQSLEALSDYVVGMVEGGIVVWPRHLGTGRLAKAHAKQWCLEGGHVGDMTTSPNEWVSGVQSLNSPGGTTPKALGSQALQSSTQPAPKGPASRMEDDSDATAPYTPPVEDVDVLDRWLRRTQG